MSAWTQDQWIAFYGVTAAGIGAVMLLMLGLRAMRQWAAPARLRPHAAHTAHVPSRMLAMPLPPRADRTAAAAWQDPMKADYTQGGVGALSSVLAAAADPALVTEYERRAWINAYADLSGAMPETDAATEAMRVNLEPALRKARVWLMRSGEVGARAVLASWRMDTPTGEYPSPFAITPRAVAAALLES